MADAEDRVERSALADHAGVVVALAVHALIGRAGVAHRGFLSNGQMDIHKAVWLPVDRAGSGGHEPECGSALVSGGRGNLKSVSAEHGGPGTDQGRNGTDEVRMQMPAAPPGLPRR